MRLEIVYMSAETFIFFFNIYSVVASAFIKNKFSLICVSVDVVKVGNCWTKNFWQRITTHKHIYTHTHAYTYIDAENS